jgi:hypothetical protein
MRIYKFIDIFGSVKKNLRFIFYNHLLIFISITCDSFIC